MAVDLVIPDIHHKWKKAEEIISWAKKEYDVNKIYFLGDYLDDWNDGPHYSRMTAEWLVKSTQDPQREHLIGNHDTPYMCNAVIEALGITDLDQIENFAQRYLRITMCSGFEMEKYRAINRVPGIEDAFKKLKTVIRYNDYIRMSHAGLAQAAPCIENHFWDLVEDYKEHKDSLDRFFKNLNLLCGAGISRGGDLAKPGPLWLDFHADRELYCGDFNQIVGHTQGKTIRSFDMGDWQEAICIDTRMEHFGILEPGEKETIFKVYQTESKKCFDTFVLVPPGVE